MCDEAGDDFLAALKIIPGQLVPSKMIKHFSTALYTYDGFHFLDEDSGVATFCCGEMCILSANFSNISLNNNFDEDDLDTIILVPLLASHSRFKKRKFKKLKHLN